MNTHRITVVLHRLHYPENIGAAARAALNMGIQHLCLVKPENWDPARALQLATHVAAPLILNAEHFDNLADALSSFHFVVGTTARTGRRRPATSTPRAAARRIAALPESTRIALLFGPEDRGLSNEELKYCQEVVTIPTAGFHSLNVAQAVLILTYECFLAARTPGSGIPSEPLATLEERERMYRRLQETLCRIDFLDPANPEYRMRKIRQTLGRFPLSSKHIRIVLGLCRQIDRYATLPGRTPEE